MISGQQTLTMLDEALRGERQKIHQLEQEIAVLQAKRAAQQQSQLQDYRELARVRVDVMDKQPLMQRLDAVEQQVTALLSQRRQAFQELDARIASITESISQLEKDRAAQAVQVDAVLKSIDESEARTQARLDADPGYVAQRDRTRESERTAMHAEDKATQSEGEQERKSAAYLNDPLFMYLYRREYGLSGYRANALARWLDGKVAVLIGYSDARPDFVRLNEIPQRLREHAERLKEAAQTEFQKLKALDTVARLTDGMQELDDRLATQQSSLDQMDARLAEQEVVHQQLLDQKTAFAAGEDEHMRNAVTYLAVELQKGDLAKLWREATETPFPDDDVIVNRMMTQQAELQKLDASLQSLKESMQLHNRLLKEIEGLRVEFKQSRFDRSGSIFGDGSLVGLMVGNFLNGMLDRNVLWRVLLEQQRYQPQYSNPRFGSGNFGRGTVWGSGLGSIPNRKGQGGFGRNGFGGFGGGRGRGGFRTGGGF